MSKKSCFLIFIATLIIIQTSFILNFAPITTEVSKVFSAMQGLYLSLAAVIISLLLSKQKYYWLIMLGLAVITAVLLEWLVVGATIMSIATLYKIVAFIVYTYLVQLIRFML